MADTVTSTIIENGNKWFAYSLTNISDGTGESAVVKIDGSSTGPLGVNIAGQVFYPGIHLKIREIEYDTQGMTVELIWGATPTPQNALLIYGYGRLKYDHIGGLVIPPSLAGATGQILLTTIAQQVNSSYTLNIRGTKGIHQ